MGQSVLCGCEQRIPVCVWRGAPAGHGELLSGHSPEPGHAGRVAREGKVRTGRLTALADLATEAGRRAGVRRGGVCTPSPGPLLCILRRRRKGCGTCPASRVERVGVQAVAGALCSRVPATAQWPAWGRTPGDTVWAVRSFVCRERSCTERGQPCQDVNTTCHAGVTAAGGQVTHETVRGHSRAEMRALCPSVTTTGVYLACGEPGTPGAPSSGQALSGTPHVALISPGGRQAAGGCCSVTSRVPSLGVQCGCLGADGAHACARVAVGTRRVAWRPGPLCPRAQGDILGARWRLLTMWGRMQS